MTTLKIKAEEHLVNALEQIAQEKWVTLEEVSNNQQGQEAIYEDYFRSNL